MSDITRRRFGQFAGALAAFAAAPARIALAAPAGRVVIVGGGFTGATCAKYLAKAAPDVSVTVIDPVQPYVTCPFSNTVIAGIAGMHSITVRRDSLSRDYGVTFIPERVTEIDPATRRVVTENGRVLEGDALVIAPGIGFDTDGIEGYGPETEHRMPHAWKAGPQTTLLREQLSAMPDGGRVLISVPPAPYRCPPGPFERASLIGHYLSQHKPRSKITILNASGGMPKAELFRQGWDELYPGMIDHLDLGPSAQVRAVNPKTMTLSTDFETYEGDVINFIPPQHAGSLAILADLTDELGWCPVDPATFESTRYANVHVLGDAARSGLPKSASAGTTGAKVCAHAIASRLTGRDFGPASFVNACYSLLAPDYAIAVGAVYGLVDGEPQLIAGASGASPLDATRDYRREEAGDARDWYASIVADSFG